MIVPVGPLHGRIAAHELSDDDYVLDGDLEVVVIAYDDGAATGAGGYEHDPELLVYPVGRAGITTQRGHLSWVAAHEVLLDSP